MRGHQRLDLLGGVVEAGGQKRHLVLPAHRYAHAQIACAPFFNTSLQPLQPLREFSDDRVSGQRHSHAHQPQRPEKAKRGAAPGGGRRARQVHVQHPAVGHAHNKLRPPPHGAATRWGLNAVAVPLHRGHHALGRQWAHSTGMPLTNQLAGLVVNHHLAQRRLGRHAPGPADQKSEYGHSQHHRQPDPDIELFKKHGSCQRDVANKPGWSNCSPDAPPELLRVLSLAGGQKRSPRRARSGCAWGSWHPPQWRRGCAPCARQSSGQRHQARARARPP